MTTRMLRTTAMGAILRLFLFTSVFVSTWFLATVVHAQTGFGPEIRVTNMTGPSVTPKLAASNGTDNLLHAIWSDVPVGSPQQIYYSRSTNNGDTWSSPAPVSIAPAPTTAVAPVVAASASKVVVLWTDAILNGDLWYRISTDGGVTWVSPPQALYPSPGTYSRPSGALVDSLGRIHIAWFDSRAMPAEGFGGGYGQTYHVMSCDNGATWSPLQRVNRFDGAVDNESPRLAEGPDGTIYMFYRSSRDGSPQGGWAPFDQYLLRSSAVACGTGITWLYPSQKVSRGMPEELGNSYGGQIFAGQGGRMHVAYWLETNGNNLAYRNGIVKPLAGQAAPPGFGNVVDISRFGPNHLEFDINVAEIGGFGIGEDTANNIHAVFGENNHINSAFQVGGIYYTSSADGGASFGPKIQASTSSESMGAHGIYHNGRFHMIWADFRDNNQGSEIYYRNVAANGVLPALLLSPSPMAFPTTAVNTSSASQAVTVTNASAAPVTVTGIVTAAPFTQTNNCATLAPGATCAVNVTFLPVAPNTVAGTLSVSYTGGTGSPVTETLSGFGGVSLVDHYYQAILGRPADAGGKVYWEGEATRMSSLGVDVKEAYMVMAGYFFSSSEYLAKNTTDTQYVTDLYNTFFNRAPDSGGLTYWTGQLGSGLPRSIVMYGFLFSPEFNAYMTGLFGNTSSRPEVYAVVDFYRGILNRLPDTAGFNSWLGQFRAAQCAGAGPVYAAVDSISTSFVQGPEYASRSRNNTDFVGDLYYAFLRRGGDLPGVTYWINRLNIGAESRDQMRKDFINTPEFNARVNAIIAQGCYTGP
jgi:hypothetical protein